MSIKLCIALWVTFNVLGFIVFCQSSAADESAPLTKEQVFALLPTGIDMDINDANKYHKLKEYGSRSYPALVEILKDADDNLLIGRIFAVFIGAKGDKTIAVNAVKGIIKKFRGKNTYDAVKVRWYAARTLGKIGKPDDIPALNELVNDNDEMVRVTAIRAVAELRKKEDNP